MRDKPSHHPWNGEQARKFANSVENLKKSRYVPFAQEINDFLTDLVDNKSPIVLDIGCGPGFLLIEIARLNPKAQLIGVDLSEDMLKIARRKAKENGFSSMQFRQGAAENIPVPDAHNDAVVCLNSLHDFQDTEETLKEVYRSTKKGGIFVLKDKNGAYPKWKVVFGFIPLVCKSGLKKTTKYFKSNELWLEPEHVMEIMESLGFKIEYMKEKLDYLIVGKK